MNATANAARLALPALLIAFLMGVLAPAAALVMPDGGDAGTGGTPTHFIWLEAGSFDPLVEGTSWVDSGWRLSSTNPAGDLYIVQLEGTSVQTETLNALRATGAQYYAYLPDNSFLLKANALQRRAMAEMDEVRAVVSYEPLFRLDQEIRLAGWASQATTAKLRIDTFGEPDHVIELVKSLSGTIVEKQYMAALVVVPRSALRTLAGDPDVVFIEPYRPRVVDNGNSAYVQGARQMTDGGFNAGTLTMWSFNPATGQYEGTTGRNVTVTVSDTGVDPTHPAFAGKILFEDGLGSTNPRDTYGHGTHTAGTVLGNGDWRASDSAIAVPGQFAGIAPDALLVVQDWDDSGSVDDNTAMGVSNAVHGSVISSNSWSSGGSYDSGARAYDRLTRDSWADTPSNTTSYGAQPVLYFFSAGNAGAARTIGSPAHAKNVIAVGSTGDNYGGVPWTQMSSFSSRGPSDDGRIKPELVAPGSHVRSATSLESGWIYEGHDYGDSYAGLSGTSMSCPGAAGAAAVAWEWYRNRVGTDPSPEMMKAILINGATEMAGYNVPGPEQGFGRVNLSIALPELPERDQLWLDRPDSLSTDDEVVYTYAVAGGMEAFAVTLVWSDEPAASGASKILVNDLDLWVVDPNGDTLWGNSMDNSGNSINYGQADSMNNVEKVKVPAAQRGYYEVHIKGKNVPVGPQDFALAVRGNILSDWYDIEVDSTGSNASSPIDGDTVTFNTTLRNRGTQWVNGTTLTMTAQTQTATLPVQTIQPAPIAPGASVNFTTEWTTVRGNVTFHARIAPPVGQSEFLDTNDNASNSFFVRGYGFNLNTEAQATYLLDPARQLILSFDVTQTGNVGDEIIVQMSSSGSPTITRIQSTTRISLLRAETKTFTVTLIVSPAAKADDVATVSLRLVSAADPRQERTFTTQATINHLYAFDAALSKNYTILEPGRSGGSSLSLFNRGNGPDTFVVDPIDVPTGWVFSFSNNSISLNDNQTGTIPLLISAPQRVDAGTRYTVIIRVTSNGAGQRTMEYMLNVSQIYGWGVDVTPPAADVRAGTVFEIPIEAQNYGNGYDRVVVGVQAPSGWQAVLTRPTMLLLPYSNLSGIVRVTVENGALAGPYTLRFTFSGDANFTPLTVGVRVAQIYALKMEGPDFTIQMGQGENNAFEVAITNEGNGPARVTPRITSPEGLTVIGIVDQALLERNSTARFTYQIIAGRHATPQVYNFTIDFMTGPDDSISNKLTVRIDLHEVEEPAPGPGEGTGGVDFLLPAVAGAIAAVALTIPIGGFYLRRRARANAPPPEVLVQTIEDANSGSTYDPTRGHHGPVPPPPSSTVQGARRAPRAPTSSAPAQMSLIGICNNCGGGLMDLGTGMARCVSCGVEQIARPNRR